MTTAEILKFLNDHPACHLATLQDGQPRVRGMLLYRADERGLTFHTGTGKALARQAHNGGLAEACFGSADRQIRVAGAVQVAYALRGAGPPAAERPPPQTAVA